MPYRAEHILQRALERSNLEEGDVVLERLKNLRAERAQVGGGKGHKRRRRRSKR